MVVQDLLNSFIPDAKKPPAAPATNAMESLKLSELREVVGGPDVPHGGYDGIRAPRG